MKSNAKTTLTALQSFLLVLAVSLSGAHAKDVVKTEALRRNDIVKVHNDDGLAKVSAELHNHVDKQTLKTFGDSQQQADRRSLHALGKGDSEAKTDLKLNAALWLRILAAKLKF